MAVFSRPARSWVAVFALSLAAAGAHAACDDAVGAFVSVTGTVEVQGAAGGDWRPASLETALCEGDTIRTGERSRAAVALINEAVLRINQNTAMRLIDITPEEEESSLLDIFTGAFQSFSRRPKFLKVNTPYLNGSVEGTEFQVKVEDGRTRILVLEGVVVAANDQGEVAVQPGEAAEAVAGGAPRRQTVVRPRDEVNWALYYPPILTTSAIATDSDAMRRAADCTDAGDIRCAFDALDEVPADQRDGDYLLLRASLLLSAGRVKDAKPEIDTAIESGTGPAAAAHALRAVIGVTQNDVEGALADGRRAVELDPDSAAAKIALSYALQAGLDLPAARELMVEATGQNPGNALAWARLAELQLAEGLLADAEASAQKAVELEELSRTQTIVGFSSLARIRPEAARTAFERAIELDSADPLPHLGVGLAKIRRGMLAEGRADIETAVALDSNNAVLRSYLGKAYFEEKRGPLDQAQWDVAKDLDPNDPTAFLFSGIGLQTENRPVEALRDIDTSIELNDNRAVYRGRLLLDQDRAARGTSLARVYNDLDFVQLGINQAADSVTLDPANASAHRFLSDTYRTLPRHETSRVSELQQAQMLQDININPIQPSLSDTNLNIVTRGGPASTGFNEFTPLFERNQVQANLSALVGSNDTIGGEAVVSGVYDRLSLSAGAFGFDTDGYRPNNDLQHEIYNLFGQFAVTPNVNVQAEYQKRNSDYGDLDMNFDPDVFSPNQHNSLDAESVRLGATLRPSVASTVLLLYNRKEADFRQTDEIVLGTLPSPPFPPGLPPIQQFEDLSTDEKSDQFEGAFVFKADGYNLFAGAAYTDVDRDDTIGVVIDNPLAPGPIPVIDDVENADSEDKRAYAYGNISLPAKLVLTLGGSYQKYEEALYDLDEFNPKIGAVWNATDSLRVRGAYFEVIKPVLSSNRTLEPTQVAGFNQFFDDLDATRAKRYGLGLDWQATSDVAIGGELTQRELKSPATDISGSAIFEDRDESTHRAYAYWTPSDRWALSAEGIYDKFENTDDSVLAAIVPDEVRTVSVPVKASYFDPRGLFGSLGVTFVDQEVRRSEVSDLPQGDSSFSVVDFAVGYRFPQRRGIVSLAVHNLFDEDFRYQDDSYREFGDEPSVAPYTPERLIMARLVLSF